MPSVIGPSGNSRRISLGIRWIRAEMDRIVAGKIDRTGNTADKAYKGKKLYDLPLQGAMHIASWTLYSES